MACTARQLGHEWAVLTDHSPRLTIASRPAAKAERTSSTVADGRGNEAFTGDLAVAGGRIAAVDTNRERLDATIAEIAAATGSNAEAAKSRLRYAVAKLKAAVEDD